MLILLPPSEGKTPARGRTPVQTGDLSHPSLTDARLEVAAALASASAREDALQLLGIGPSLAAEAERNVRLLEEPAAPAREVYTGVLYEASGMSDWDASAKRFANAHVRTVSALWGLVSPGDRIPAYRLSMSVKLPGIGGLPAFWRPRLAPELETLAGGGLVVDCRSGGYASVWRPRDARIVSVNAVQVRAGTRTVVSHFAKHYRGLLAGALVRSRTTVRSIDELAHVASALVGDGIDAVEATERELTLVVG